MKLSSVTFEIDCFVSARITIKPTLVENKCQAIKARVHANIYLRENNNNSGANPPFGPPLCRGKKVREGGGKGVLRDVGNTTSKRKRERKEEGESSPSMFNACSFTYIYMRMYSRVRVALNFFFRARISRIQFYYRTTRRRARTSML